MNKINEIRNPNPIRDREVENRTSSFDKLQKIHNKVMEKGEKHFARGKAYRILELKNDRWLYMKHDGDLSATEGKPQVNQATGFLSSKITILGNYLEKKALKDTSFYDTILKMLEEKESSLKTND